MCVSNLRQLFSFVDSKPDAYFPINSNDKHVLTKAAGLKPNEVYKSHRTKETFADGG